MANTDLRGLVRDKIAELGPAAPEYFGVSAATIANWSSGKTSPSLDAAAKVLDDRIPAQPAFDPNEPEFQWEGRKVMLLLPVYRTFSGDTHRTLFANYGKYGPDKMGVLFEKGTMIHEARNRLVHKAMKTDADIFIMCDDDMVLPCGVPGVFNGLFNAGVTTEQASFNALTRILSHPEEKGIIGALYFGRHEFGAAQCASGFSANHEKINDEFRRGVHKGLKPEDWVGTGLIKFHRSHILKMKAHIDAGNWPECKPKRADLWYGYFEPEQAGVGEDVSFSRRAKSLGIPVNLDASLVCLHTGECHYGPRNTRNRKP